MLTEAHKAVCRQAVEKFGRRRQALKVVEELRELADEIQAAVEKFGRRRQALKVVEELRELADEIQAAVEGFGSVERIIDERADVALVLYQLDELLMPQMMACVAAHVPVKIKKLQRYLEEA